MSDNPTALSPRPPRAPSSSANAPAAIARPDAGAVPDEDIEPADSTALDPRPDDGPVTRAPLWRRLREIDAGRPGLPGEHLLALGLGGWLLLRGMRGRTPLGRVLLTLAGSTLVGRAASGTGGIARIARALRRWQP